MADEDPHRRTERLPLHAEIDFRRTGEHRYRVELLDFSPEGCRIELPERVIADEIIWISLPGLESLQARVCWEKDWVAGVEFIHPIHPSVFEMIQERLKDSGS